MVLPTRLCTARPRVRWIRSAHRSAQELGPKKIRVNSLNPGLIETEGVHAAGFIGSEFQKTAEARTPFGRIGQPKDIATAAALLASDESGWINGQAIHAAGGFRL